VVCAGAAVVSARRPDSTGVALVPVLVTLLAPSALVLGGYAVLATATSAAAQFVAAMLLAAACSAAVVLLVAGPLRRVNFDPARAGSRLSR
jgi:hypothetical protein